MTQHPASELLPCKCGSLPSMVRHGWSEIPMHWIHCLKCGLQTQPKYSVSAAEAAWNKGERQ